MAYEELENIELNEYNYETDKTVDFVNGVAGVNNTNSNTKRIKALFVNIANWLKKKADLDNDGKVLSSQLPDSVNSVLEFTLKSELPSSGVSNRLYIIYGDTSENNGQYRWNGTNYEKVSTQLDYATKIEAETGTDNTKVMTPLRTSEQLDKKLVDVNNKIKIQNSVPTTNGTILWIDTSDDSTTVMDASNINIKDIGNNFNASNVESALSELKTDMQNNKTNITIANENTLGGIKASPKTDTETLEVKIDTLTGKLYSQANTSNNASNVLQATKLNVVAPKDVNINILNTLSFNRVPVEALKFTQGLTNQTTKCNFNNDDITDFETNEFIEFDGTMKLKKNYKYKSTSPITVNQGFINESVEFIDLSLYKYIGGVN